MISAVAILMLCNGIRMSLKSEKYNQRNRVCHGVHDTPFSFLHFFVSSFFSSDFTDESEAFLLIGLLTDFRGYLASGQWLAPYICSCCFLSRRFRRWRRFFFVGIILSHRFHRYTQIFLCGTYSNSRGYLHRPDRSPLRKSVSNCLRRKSPNKFRVIR